MRLSLVIILFVQLLFACSTEENVMKSMEVSNVSNTSCKQPSNLRTTRATDGQITNSLLAIESFSNGSLKCRIEDLEGSCDMDKINVSGSLSNGKISVVLYKNKETYADCLCNYDVSFSLDNLVSGKYQIEIYTAKSLQDVSLNNLRYKGTVNLSNNLDGELQFIIPKISL